MRDVRQDVGVTRATTETLVSQVSATTTRLTPSTEGAAYRRSLHHRRKGVCADCVVGLDEGCYSEGRHEVDAEGLLRGARRVAVLTCIRFPVPRGPCRPHIPARAPLLQSNCPLKRHLPGPCMGCPPAYITVLGCSFDHRSTCVRSSQKSVQLQ